MRDADENAKVSGISFRHIIWRMTSHLAAIPGPILSAYVANPNVLPSRSELVSFLGDPNFPSKLIDATSHDGKIRMYEDLYCLYSRLTFTHISDRPIAIAGLEQRLIRAMEVRGGFGVFDDGRGLFQRSLLWQRGREVPSLAKIDFSWSFSSVVPTWSWMAYDGGIDFPDVSLDSVDWLMDDIRSPWAPEGADTWHTGDGKESVEFEASARPFAMGNLGFREAHDGIMIVYDNPDLMDVEGADQMCVVLGKAKDKGMTQEEMVHFVLVVTLSKGSLDTQDGSKVYERVGVGHMKGRYLDLKSPAQSVVIR